MPSSGPDLNTRLEEIEHAENMIKELMNLAKTCVSELSKEKQSTKSKLDEPSNQFKQKLGSINTILSSHMSYLQNVCVGIAHQGSTFVSQQNIEIAKNSQFSLHTDLTHLSEKYFNNPPTEGESMDTTETPETPVDPPSTSGN